MPFVNRIIVLYPRICARPCGITYLLPHILRFHCFIRFPVNAANKIPIAICVNHAHERVWHTNRIIGILARYGCVGLAFKMRIISRRNQSGYFFLFFYFPIDKFLNFRMIKIQTHHFRRAPGCAT